MPRCIKPGGRCSWNRGGPEVSGYERLNLGSSVSRMQSPKKFNANTTMVMATPGSRDSHHTSRMTLRPSDSMMPQAGCPGESPSPRKLRDASSKITCPTCRLVIIIRVLMVLGKMCRQIIMGMDSPAILAKVTKST